MEMETGYIQCAPACRVADVWLAVETCVDTSHLYWQYCVCQDGLVLPRPPPIPPMRAMSLVRTRTYVHTGRSDQRVRNRAPIPWFRKRQRNAGHEHHSPSSFQSHDVDACECLERFRLVLSGTHLSSSDFQGR